MFLDNQSDPLLSERREPPTAWERSLRPANSSNRLLLVTLLVATLLLVVALSRGWLVWPGQERSRTQRGAVGSPASTAVAPASALPPETGSRAEPPRVQHFTKCLTASGGATYSDGPCPAGMRASTVAVRPDINLADGMNPNARAASIQENSLVTQELVAHERRVAMNVDGVVAECGQLDSVIAALDAEARQPLPGSEQDRIRGERKRARDRQFALRCR